MDQQFTLLAKEADMLCRDYFGKRLAACYLHGSIAMGDAIAGISDLDYYVVLSESLTEEDRSWLCNTKEQLEGRYSICPEVHLTVCTVEELKGNSFARFALKYNAQRMSGADVLSSMENDGYPVPLPDAAMAKGRLDFARQCFRDALEGKQPACTGEIPVDPGYAARKFARYFVVIEGAYFLMSRGEFTCFAKDMVLASLQRLAGDYEHALEMTGRVLQDPQTAGVDGDTLLKTIAPLVWWMFDEIEKA